MKNPQHTLQTLETASLRRILRNIECLPNGLARLENGQIVMNLASNDYMGLAHHPALQQAMVHTLQTQGAGAMASRLVTGTRTEHSLLETALAELKGTQAALSFSSGYATALGVIPSIVSKHDIVLLDKLAHASLIDGAKLSGARIATFLHNDTASLRKKLSQLRQSHPPDTGILIVTESVFSMDGDQAPLQEIVALKEEFDAMLLVDEAHGFGIFGEHGAGVIEALHLSEHVDFQLGTLSKSAGLSGGYVACSHDWVQVMINSARSFIYSTAPLPALAQAAIEAINIIRGEEGKKRRAHLHRMMRYFAEAMQLPPPSSSIFPLVIGGNEQALAMATKLTKSGFLAPAIRYPTVPNGTARLRLTLTAAHTMEQVQNLVATLKQLLPGIKNPDKG